MMMAYPSINPNCGDFIGPQAASTWGFSVKLKAVYLLTSCYKIAVGALFVCVFFSFPCVYFLAHQSHLLYRT